MTLACTRHYIWTNLWKITFSSRTHRKYSTMKVNFRFECTDNLLRRLIEQSCNGYKTHLWWKSSSITKTSTLLKFRFYIRRRQRWINICQTRHDQLKGGWKDAKEFSRKSSLRLIECQAYGVHAIILTCNKAEGCSSSLCSLNVVTTKISKRI